jgi:hypothetical protein
VNGAGGVEGLLRAAGGEPGKQDGGQAAVDRLRTAHPSAIMIHTSAHASWLNQAEIFFSIIQKEMVSPNGFAGLDELSRTLLAFVDRYRHTARPFNRKFTASDLNDLLRRISEHETIRPAASQPATAASLHIIDDTV